jgi:hypothetical protein
LECPYGAKGCPGGFNAAGIDAGQSCNPGYEGPLCGVCNKEYYFQSTSRECLPCAGQGGGAGAGQLAALIIVPLILLGIAVLMTSTFLMDDKMRTAIARGSISPLMDGQDEADDKKGKNAPHDNVDEEAQQFSAVDGVHKEDINEDVDCANNGQPTHFMGRVRKALTFEYGLRKLNELAAASRKSGIGTKLRILVTACQVWYSVQYGIRLVNR